ncbi:hypothetical protein K502DRAFT_340690 [Neoconidiobolus thromboides FSU 785]|nr:hypothetical protein K502DRAFT_340690 [Neoconidiobolus thromboides FSU 785]
MSDKQPSSIPQELQLQFNNLFDIPLNDPLLSLLQTFIANSLHLSSKVELEDIELNQESWEQKVGEYAKQGLWRGLATFMKQQIATTDNSQILLLLKLWCYRLISLIKLNLCQLASAELDKLDNLFDKKYRFENQPELFPNRKGPMIPFVLLVIWAKLPGYLGDNLISIDRIYYLINYCRKVNKFNPEQIQLWKNRIIQLSLILTNYLLKLKELILATTIIEQLTLQSDCDFIIWNCCIRLYLYGGNIKEAEIKIKQYNRYELIDNNYKLNLLLNNTLLLMSKAQWNDSIQLIETYLDKNENNFKLNNLLAINYLYIGNLNKSITILKQTIEQFTKENSPLLPAIILKNLSTSYELITIHHLKKKKQILDLIHPYLGDGYDIDAFKFN